MGYDMVNKNAMCLREGSISFLIAQHAYMQGQFCMEALFNAIVLKKEIAPINYMPIELITRENMDFYQRTFLTSGDSSAIHSSEPKANNEVMDND